MRRLTLILAATAMTGLAAPGTAHAQSVAAAEQPQGGQMGDGHCMGGQQSAMDCMEGAHHGMGHGMDHGGTGGEGMHRMPMGEEAMEHHGMHGPDGRGMMPMGGPYGGPGMAPGPYGFGPYGPGPYGPRGPMMMGPYGPGPMMGGPSMTQGPGAGGQAAFSTIQGVVAMLLANPGTDWSKVDIEALRQHLIDMDNVTLRADVAAEDVDGGAKFTVTSDDPKVTASIRAMVTAHAETMGGQMGWTMATEEVPGGETLTVTGSDPERIRALGFIGIMTVGAHHQMHHIALATGQNPHQH